MSLLAHLLGFFAFYVLFGCSSFPFCRSQRSSLFSSIRIKLIFYFMNGELWNTQLRQRGNNQKRGCEEEIHRRRCRPERPNKYIKIKITKIANYWRWELHKPMWMIALRGGKWWCRCGGECVSRITASLCPNVALQRISGETMGSLTG